MKSLLCFPILIYILFSSVTLNAQTLHDSIYNDVIEYNDKNTEKIGTHYLTTVPRDVSSKALIFYNNAGIPDSLFFSPLSFHPELKRFILISPRMSRILSIPGGGHARTTPSVMLYHVRRENKLLQVDSLEHWHIEPQLHFHKFAELPDKAQLAFLVAT